MTTVTQSRIRRSALLSYFSLFTSLGTLLCCALPSLLVLFGLGASVASMLTFLPWLVTLSRHKQWTFMLSGLLIGLGVLNTYLIAPRFKTKGACETGDDACGVASKASKIVLWISAAMYAVGFFVVCIGADIEQA